MGRNLFFDLHVMVVDHRLEEEILLTEESYYGTTN